jgi:indole-3-glycerol phosphate synthase
MKEIVVELEEILEAKRSQLEIRKHRTPIEAVRALASMQKRPLPLLNTVMNSDHVLLIGQIRYSPHVAGSPSYDPVGEAVRYARGGVDAISLFTDATIYDGGLDDLMFVSRAVASLDMPVISQDYIFDEYQIVEVRAAGAAALMLSASLLDEGVLRKLVSATHRNRMTAIVRIANEAELSVALDLSPQVITLSPLDPVTNALDMQQVAALRVRIPSHTHVLIAEGLHTVDDVACVVRMGVNAVLIDNPALLGTETGDQLRQALNRST